MRISARKPFAFLTGLVMTVSFLQLFAFQAFATSPTFYTDDGMYEYRINGSTVSIVTYSGNYMGNTDVVIPDIINSMPVTEIETLAFSMCDAITMTVPASITSIGDDAFSDTTITTFNIFGDNVVVGARAFQSAFNPTAISTVTFYGDGAAIGDQAFLKCTQLTNVNLGGAVSIGNSAFSGCTSLNSITIPDTVASIGTSAFADNTEIICYDGSVAYEYAADTGHLTSGIPFYSSFKGAQAKYNASTSTYDIRFIATVDSLNGASEVGFVFSKTNESPTVGGDSVTLVKTTKVRTSVIAGTSTVTAKDLGGRYIVCCKVEGIPAAEINQVLYVRAYAKTLTGDYNYSGVSSRTVSGLIN